MNDFPLRLRHSSGATMSLERDRLLVSFRKSSPRRSAAALGIEAARAVEPDAERKDALDKLGLRVEDDVDHVGGGPAIASHVEGVESSIRRRILPTEEINNTDTRQWTLTKDGKAFAADSLDATLNEDEGLRTALDWVAPVYALNIKGKRELIAPMPNALLVKRAKGITKQNFAKGIKQFGLKVDEKKSKYLGDFVYLVVKDPMKESALELIPKLRGQTDLVSEVRFETMPMVIPTAFVPNAPLYPSQWNMERIRAGGTGVTAWNLSKGNPGVIICILDSGCDQDHSDLTFSSPGVNLGDMTSPGVPTDKHRPHGTACAGIAAAAVVESGTVAGLAGECQILPVAFVNWTEREVAAGIRYAADHGARVISMSFGDNAWDANIIGPAIQEAFDKNVVMCVATHNHDGPITYPATDPLVMACGASDRLDNRKTPGGGDDWGSNFGGAMSVVAPGIEIPTTDITGNEGFNPVEDFHLNFWGTSAATPHVSGLAALLISLRPSLTNMQVRKIIELTAAKVGDVDFDFSPGKPNGTWNQEMGYGRIDALKAVQTVLEGEFDSPASPLAPFVESHSVDFEMAASHNYSPPVESLLARIAKLESLVYGAASDPSAGRGG